MDMAHFYYVYFWIVHYAPCPEKRVYGIFDISLTNVNLFLQFLT